MTFTSIACDEPGCQVTIAIAGAGTTHAIRLVAEARDGWACETNEVPRRALGGEIVRSGVNDPRLPVGRDFCAGHAHLADPRRSPLADRAVGRRIP